MLLFVYAAGSKILDFETFRVQLEQSPVLSAYAGFIAWAVPAVEVGLAVLLTVPYTQRLALFGCFLLMVMFTAYIYITLNFSDFVPCSCGGVLENLSWTQHLFFNVGLILLAGLALAWESEITRWWRRLLPLGSVGILGVGIVTVMFGFSEKKMHRNNAFQRRYIPHPIEKTHSFDLRYSSYYFAGAGNGKVYLGNTTAPLLMTVFDSSLTDTIATMIQLDQMDLPYRAVKIEVLPPNFYVADGTVPIILLGDITDWKAKTKMQGDYYFNHAYPINKDRLAVQSISGLNQENTIGIIDMGDSLSGVFSDKLLEKQIDGVFDTDGRLLYNSHLDKLIFTYYYRNAYLGINQNLELAFRGRTIDTITRAQIHIAKNFATGERKLGGNTLLINRQTSTAGQLLLVDSPRLGKLEPENMMEEANILDVYDLTDQSYRFSFYLYKHEKSKAREFIIGNGRLYALQGNYIVAYKLSNRHFD